MSCGKVKIAVEKTIIVDTFRMFCFGEYVRIKGFCESSVNVYNFNEEIKYSMPQSEPWKKIRELFSQIL